jgi:chromosome segregation ATPase
MPMSFWDFDFMGTGEVRRSLKRLDDKTDLLLKQMEKLMAKIDDLAAAVERNTEVGASVVTLLNGIAQQLRDAQGDPAKIEALIATLDSETQTLKDAVVANTPVEDEEPTEPTPPA